MPASAAVSRSFTTAAIAIFSRLSGATDAVLDRYIQSLEERYGPRATDAAVRAGDEPWSDPTLSAAYPLVEPLLANSEGVIVHSHDHGDAIRAIFPGPVADLFLPSYPTDWIHQPRPRPSHNPTIALVSIGHVNPNKQIDRVIRLLADDVELARRVRYDIVGPYEEASEYFRFLIALVKQHRLERTVKFHGYQTDAALQGLMDDADIFVNLRQPNLEGASASFVRQLPFGRPVLVFSSGVFAEVPADAVAAIHPGDDRALRETLRRLVEHPKLRDAIGVRGREYARSLSLDRYTERFLAFLDEVRAARPLLELVDRVGDELAGMGVEGSMSVVRLVATELESLAAND